MTRHTIENWSRDPSIAAIVKATFPAYKRKKVTICPSETVTLCDLNWSGGTRNEYRTCTIAGYALGSADRFHSQAPWNNQGEGQKIPIPVGGIMVQGGYFCGKESLLTLYVNPADMPKFLTHQS